MRSRQMDPHFRGNDRTKRVNDKAEPSTTIRRVHAREVLDSRGVPTVEVDVTLASGARGRAVVPSGASTGRHEALEFRDGDPARYQGKGVRHAVRHVNEVLGPVVLGMDATRQHEVDALLLDTDGTPNLRRLGGNAVLGVSLATAHAAAESLGLPLYRYLGGSLARELPVPMVNILSGGLHARGIVDFQDFLLIPVGAQSFSDALVMVRNVYHAMGEILADRGASTLVADEGGLRPSRGMRLNECNRRQRCRVRCKRGCSAALGASDRKSGIPSGGRRGNRSRRGGEPFLQRWPVSPARRGSKTLYRGDGVAARAVGRRLPDYFD